METIINSKTLTENYPELKYNEEKQEITGNIHIEYICNDEFIKGDFNIQIRIFNDDLPQVWEISNKIRK